MSFWQRLFPLGLMGLTLLYMGMSGCRPDATSPSAHQSPLWQRLGQFPADTQVWVEAPWQSESLQSLLKTQAKTRLPASSRQLIDVLSQSKALKTACHDNWLIGLSHRDQETGSLACNQCDIRQPVLSTWLRQQGYYLQTQPAEAQPSRVATQVWHQPQAHLWWVQHEKQSWLVTSRPLLSQLLNLEPTQTIGVQPWYLSLKDRPIVAEALSAQGQGRFLAIAQPDLLPLPQITGQQLLKQWMGRTALSQQFPIVLGTFNVQSSRWRHRQTLEGQVWMPWVDSAQVAPTQKEALLNALATAQEFPSAVLEMPASASTLRLKGGNVFLGYLLAYGPDPVTRQGLQIGDQVTRLHGVSLLQDIPQLFDGTTLLSWNQDSPQVALQASEAKVSILNRLSHLAGTLPQKVVRIDPLASRHEADGWLWQFQWPHQQKSFQLAVLPQSDRILLGPVAGVPSAEVKKDWKPLRGSPLPLSQSQDWLQLRYQATARTSRLPGVQQLTLSMGWQPEEKSQQGHYQMTLTPQ